MSKDNNEFNSKQFEHVTRDVVTSLQTLFKKRDLQKSPTQNAAKFTITFVSGSTGNLYLSTDTVTLTLRRPKAMADIPYLRGQADHFTLKINYHNADTHKALRPSKGQHKDNITTVHSFFDFLEDIRTDAIGSTEMKGVARNTASYFDLRTKEFIQSETKRIGSLSKAEHEALAYRILLRESLINEPISKELQALAAPYKTTLEPIIQRHRNSLLNTISSQQKFGLLALDLLQELFPDQDIKKPAPNENDLTNDDDSSTSDMQDDQNNETRGESDHNGDDQGQQMDDGGSEDGIGVVDGEEQTIETGETSDQPQEGSEEPGGPSGARKPIDNIDVFDDYSAYTKDDDEIIKAEDLCPNEERQRLYETLKKDTEELRSEVRHIGQKLRRFLASQQRTTWNFDQEEGMLDTARLSRIIMSPTTPLSFKTEKENPLVDTVVTLLVDNSGSMRGRPINTAATCTDILADALEQCGVKTEVLGFTTKAWKGGKSFQKWLTDGKPKNPGRINDLRHIIYKPAEKPLRRCRANFGVMIRESLLKENIDGEALLWARERLLRRPEKRKILIVISDGAPVDDATDSQNKTGFLVKHLKKVITDIEADKRIELSAIGIGHDVTRYYEKSVKIDNSHALAKTLADRLLLLFTDENDPQSRRIAKRIKMQMN